MCDAGLGIDGAFPYKRGALPGLFADSM